MDIPGMRSALLAIGLIVGAAVIWLVKTGRVREAPQASRDKLCLRYPGPLCVTLPAVLLLTEMRQLAALIRVRPLRGVLLAAGQRIFWH